MMLNAEVSKTQARVGQTTNVVIGGTVVDDSTDEWLALDKKVQLLCLSPFLLPFHYYLAY
jgi:hypothetical protein